MPIKPSIVGAIFALGFVTCIHGKSTPSSTKDGNKKEAGPPPGVLPMTSRFCAWNEKFGSGGGNWNEDFHENVSYQKLFKTNTNDLGSSLDKETGVFTTPYDGYWEISYTYEATVDDGVRHPTHLSEVYLMAVDGITGEERILDRSLHMEQSGIYKHQNTRDNYQDTMHHLSAGSTVYLKVHMLSGYMYNVMFCVACADYLCQ